MKKHFTTLLALTAFCATLFSFTPIGGESYTIHMNNKLIAQYHVGSKESIPSISLNRSSANEQLSIYYNECGKIGKDRKLTLKDEKGNLVKEWSFKDATDEHTPMSFKTNDIASLKRADKLKLVYASRLVSDGRVLATVTIDEPKARK